MPDKYDNTMGILGSVIGGVYDAAGAVQAGVYDAAGAVQGGIYDAGRGAFELAEGIEEAGVDVVEAIAVPIGSAFEAGADAVGDSVEALGDAFEAGADAVGDIAKSTAGTAVVFGGLTTVFGLAFFGVVGYAAYKWL